MSAFLNPPLVPRNGRTLEVLLACRVSDIKPGKQDERSLDDQEAEHRQWMKEHTDLPFNITVISGTGSGENLQRDEYLELIAKVDTQFYDLVLTEDLGRIVRRIHAHLFCEHCVDNDVRLIALNDAIDTAQEGWEDRSIFSAWHHERSNRDTSNRIKRTHRNRFNHGGCLPLIIYGYEKKPGAKSDDDIEKLAEAEPIYKEWFRRLDEDDAKYTEIADWLNAEQVPTGPYCRADKWDCRIVSRVTHNWILKGVRFRNKRKTKRNNKTGKYKSEKAPASDLLTRRVPHLAFFEEAYYDYVVAKVDARNAKYRRKGDNGCDPRHKVPKKKTRYPGQSMWCGVCGRLYVFGGHGQKEHLMCTGARHHKCWNGITFSGPDASSLLVSVIYGEIEALPAFEPEFLAMLEEEITQLDSSRLQGLKDLKTDQIRNQREVDNILAALRESGSSAVLLAELQRLEQQQTDLSYRHGKLAQSPKTKIVLPSVDVVKQLAREEFSKLAVESYQFTEFMRRLVPSIFVFPFRLCDGGHIVLRASISFTAAPLLPREAQALPGLTNRLTSHHCVDLFEPPQREEFRKQILEMHNEKDKRLTEREIASHLGVTQPVVQRAKALAREMERLGIADPYIPIKEPPEDYKKLRRHLHKRYKFEPLDGFPLAWPE